MQEIIQKIEIVEEYNNDTISKYAKLDGYKITTNIQEILVLINNYQSCCESWGYLTSLDNLTDFDGSELLNIELVDIELNSIVYEELQENMVSQNEAMFVNFHTSNGKFQMVVYNSHNGYYGHNVYLISNQLKHKEHL